MAKDSRLKLLMIDHPLKQSDYKINKIASFFCENFNLECHCWVISMTINETLTISLAKLLLLYFD